MGKIRGNDPGESAKNPPETPETPIRRRAAENVQFYGRWKASEKLLVRSAIWRAESSFRRELKVPWVVQRTYQGNGSVFYLAQREGSGRPLVAATAEALAFHILSDARRHTENLAQKKTAVDGKEWPLPR